MPRPDARQRDRVNAFLVGQFAHARQGGLDRLVGGPRAPVIFLRREVEDPRPALILPEEAVAGVELTRLGFTLGAIRLVHLRVALAEANCDAGPHRALAVAA